MKTLSELRSICDEALMMQDYILFHTKASHKLSVDNLSSSPQRTVTKYVYDCIKWRSLSMSALLVFITLSQPFNIMLPFSLPLIIFAFLPKMTLTPVEESGKTLLFIFVLYAFLNYVLF